MTRFTGFPPFARPLAAILLFVLIQLPANRTAADSPELWTLKRIVVANGMNQFATITDEHYDAKGGEVYVSGDGRALDLCSGGFERLRFKWTFPQDITRVSDGGTLSVSLEAGPGGHKEPCNGQIGAISDISVAGSAGITFPLSEDDMKVMDVDRFFTKESGDAWAGRDPRTGLGSVGVNTREPVEGRPFAYFFIRIGMRGMGPGELRYVYIYERGGGPVGPVGGGGGGNACGHTLGSGIYNKWQQLGGENGLLGCAASDEAEAGASPQGTTGRYAFFNKDVNGGLIVWHRTGPRAGQAFEVHGCMFNLYQSLGGTGSWLGFPVSDEYDVPGGRRSDFENGYIFWNAQTRVCQAFRTGGGNLTVEQDVDRPGADYQNFDLDEPRYELCRDACANDASCKAYTYVKPGMQALNARCWLKSSVPDPVPSPCCISGMKQ
jgi:hypothetical protein